MWLPINSSRSSLSFIDQYRVPEVMIHA
jgi:hypothetical protein